MIKIDISVSDLIENNIHFLERENHLRKRIREEVDEVNESHIVQYDKSARGFLIGNRDSEGEYFNFWLHEESLINIFDREKVENIITQLRILDS